VFIVPTPIARTLNPLNTLSPPFHAVVLLSAKFKKNPEGYAGSDHFICHAWLTSPSLLSLPPAHLTFSDPCSKPVPVATNRSSNLLEHPCT